MKHRCNALSNCISGALGQFLCFSDAIRQTLHKVRTPALGSFFHLGQVKRFLDFSNCATDFFNKSVNAISQTLDNVFAKALKDSGRRMDSENVLKPVNDAIPLFFPPLFKSSPSVLDSLDNARNNLFCPLNDAINEVSKFLVFVIQLDENGNKCSDCGDN